MELRENASRLLQSIDSALENLERDSKTGLRSFAVFDLLCSIARNDRTNSLNLLHDMAERNVGNEDLAICEAFVERHFAALVWSRLLASSDMWMFTDNRDNECYQPFNKTYTECREFEFA